MLKFLKNLNLIIPQVHTSWFPAFIFACAFLGYFFYGEVSPLARNYLHINFWCCSLLSIIVLIFFNRRKPIFFILIGILSYTIINWLKKQYSLDYLSSSEYINLCFFAPINLAIFYFLPNRRLLNIYNLLWLIFIFLQFALAEYLSQYNITISFNSPLDGINLNSLSIILFTLFIISAFIKCSLNGYIDDTALFFSSLNIFAGFYYSASSTALSIFFSAAAITTTVGIISNIHYNIHYDFLTGLASRRTYLEDAKKFPLKYSLAIICLDNFKHLYKILGYYKSQNLIKMLANRLVELEPENPIYRYSQDEFIIIFKNDNLKQSFEKLDNIRREIASSEFMFSHRRKGLKITISGCVSEKKRSDSNPTEVLLRAHRTLQKTYQFTQNLISKA